MTESLLIEGLFTDYDGTLAPINSVREASGIAARLTETLEVIASRVPVGVITTKDLHFIRTRTPFARAWSAVGGLETNVPPAVFLDPRVTAQNREDLACARDYARREINGSAVIEEKRDSRGQVLADVHFIIAGRGGSPYAAKVKELAAKLSNVSFVGELDEKEKVQLIKASYINILLSRLEALGLAQLEFMYHGVPVITSAVGGQSWVVGNGEEGIHVGGPDDIDGAVAAIRRLTSEPDVWKRMSANARRKAESTASSKIISELDTVIDQELMKESGLMTVPSEVRDTLREPEQVLRSWRAGGTGVVATNQRLFVRTGAVSRRVIETRYDNVRSIEHTRDIPWRTALDGLLLTGLLLALPFMRPLFSVELLAWIDGLLKTAGTFLPAPEWVKQIIGTYYAAVPLIVANIVLIVRSQYGFYLYEIGRKPVFLSAKFKEAITLIRSLQDVEPEKRPELEKEKVAA
jgi:hypothetical protein